MHSVCELVIMEKMLRAKHDNILLNNLQNV